MVPKLVSTPRGTSKLSSPAPLAVSSADAALDHGLAMPTVPLSDDEPASDDVAAELEVVDELVALVAAALEDAEDAEDAADDVDEPPAAHPTSAKAMHPETQSTANIFFIVNPFPKDQYFLKDYCTPASSL